MAGLLDYINGPQHPSGLLSNVNSATPEAYATDRGGLLGSMLHGLLNIPQRAFESSNRFRETGEYDPGPILEAAMLPMGTGAIAGVPVKGAEAVLGAGPIRAYHGSPHDFDRFDISKIGTGEGAQAYGHGLYFAENEGVARGYRDALAPGQTLLLNGKKAASLPTSEGYVVNAMHNWGQTPQQIAEKFDALSAKELQKAKADGGWDIAREMGVEPSDLYGTNHRNIADAARRIASGPAEITVGKNGHMYEVNINADPAHFLDWDKHLSQQSEHVRGALGYHDRGTRAADLARLEAEVAAAQKAVPVNTNQPFNDFYASLFAETPETKALGEAVMRRNALREQIARSEGPSQNFTGEQIMRGETTAGRASDPAKREDLLSKGIPGIKYLDAGSRRAGDGSSNYVVFNDKIIDIRRKYAAAGIAIPPAVAAAYGMQDQQ